jgi:regulator of sigma E protease
MLHLLISIAGVILTILFVVGTHEAGHFLAARAVGVKVITFSIGFGKKIFSWRDKSGTEYVFALIPLGGYVRMLDESEAPVAEHESHRAYNQQPYYKKFIIVAAGPFTNFLCAFLLYWLIFSIGFVTIKPIIGEVKPRSIAAEAGLKPQQEITRVDGQDIKTWTNVLFRLLAHTGSKDHLTMSVTNPGSPQEKSITLELSNWKMDDLNPNPLESIGITPYEPPLKLEIGTIKPDSAAARSSLAIGDKLIAVNKAAIKDWIELSTVIQNHPNQELIFTIKRQSKTMDIAVTVGSHRNWLMQQKGSLGISPSFHMPENLLQKVHYSPLSAIPKAFHETVDFAHFNLLLFGKMLTGKLSLESLGGPITIFDSAGDSLNYGFLPFISFLAFLSISIGIINILPIPGLDGGHLFIQTIEAITRRTLPENAVLFMYRIGFLFIIFIMLHAMINDVLRLMP